MNDEVPAPLITTRNEGFANSGCRNRSSCKRCSAQLNAQMIRISQRVVAVTDSSKLLRRNLSVIAPVDQMDVLITDSAADSACIEAIRAQGVDVRLV